MTASDNLAPHPGIWAILFLGFLSMLNTLTAEAEDNSSNPVPVEIGIRLQQIVEINQKKKNFTAVISIKAKWQDPLLAFDPSKHKAIMVLNKEEFKSLTREKGTLFPAAVIYNQQGRQHTKNSLIMITPEGEVRFQEHATAVLQAKHFDFRHFPFDTQLFEIHVDSLFPEDLFVFKKMPEYSSLNDELGEEEWLITDFSSRVTSNTDTTGIPTSRFTLTFTAKRHIVYYITKIFIPLTLIIIVSWFTFFLKDYAKRIDLAGANLLLFIAFNFTISNELPKLGYITFLDALLVSTFIITSIVILINVMLKRLQNLDRNEVAEAIDRYALWSYPLIYCFAVIITSTFIFLD